MTPSRILVVEDEVIVSMEIKERLRAMGYVMAGSAASGETALERISQEQPDLVLMDIRLQGNMDGITAAQEIRKRHHLPVIFLTAYSEDTTLDRAKLAEPYGFILKPFDDRELKSTIEIALHKHNTEEEIRRLNRLYDVLSQVNQTIVRANSREELFEGVCCIVVERGGIDLAWIGWLDAATSKIHPVAQWGKHEKLLRKAEFSVNDRPVGQGNPGVAIRAGEPFICNECIAENCLYPSEFSPAQFGFKSYGSFPILFQGRVCGVLCLGMEKAMFFQEQEIRLLKEVALDISFALDKLESDFQRKRLYEENQQQLRFVQTLMDAIPFPVFFKDAELRFLGCNRTYEQVMDIKREQLLGKTVFELFPRELGQVYDDADRKLLNSSGDQVYEAQVKVADSKLRDVLFHKAIFNNPDGAAGGIIGVMEDITEHKQAETSLRMSEEKLRSILRAAPVGIGFVIDRIILEVNNHLCTMTGYSQEELLGQKARMLYPTEEHYREVGTEKYRQIAEKGTGTLETKWRRKDGIVIDILLSSTPLKSGDISEGVTFTAIDITERKRSEEALKNSQERYRSLVESSSDWIWEVDTRIHYTQVSSKVLEILGYTPEEVIGRSPFDFMPQEEAQRINGVFEEILSQQRPFSLLENINLHRDGRQVFIETSGVPIFGTGGEFLGYRGIDRDITERKKAEKEKERLESQLRQAQKMEAIGNLAGGIAHDFNNILSPIIGYTEMVMTAIPESDPKRYDLKQVLIAAGRAKDLVAQILSFSRLGDQPLMRIIDLSLILKEALRLLRATLPSSIDIRQRIQRVMALADATQLHQVVINLCTNAAHAMDDTGTLEVSLEVVELGTGDLMNLSLQPGEYVKLSVKDNGTGMSVDTLGRIFEPYFTTKGIGKGTGLGLAVVHGIIARHDGEIRVTSELGKGSLFEVFIPAVNSEMSTDIVPPQDLPKGSERILLVDDERVIADLGTKMLEQLGYRVTAVTGPEDALNLFRSKPGSFDLIITDYTMPQMVGAVLARECLRIRPGMPIIICTGYSERLSKGIIEEMGIRGYAMKPLNRKQLAELVRNVLDERPA